MTPLEELSAAAWPEPEPRPALIKNYCFRCRKRLSRQDLQHVAYAKDCYLCQKCWKYLTGPDNKDGRFGWFPPDIQRNMILLEDGKPGPSPSAGESATRAAPPTSPSYPTRRPYVGTVSSALSPTRRRAKTGPGAAGMTDIRTIRSGSATFTVDWDACKAGKCTCDDWDPWCGLWQASVPKHDPDYADRRLTREIRGPERAAAHQSHLALLNVEDRRRNIVGTARAKWARAKAASNISGVPLPEKACLFHPGRPASNTVPYKVTDADRAAKRHPERWPACQQCFEEWAESIPEKDLLELCELREAGNERKEREEAAA